MAGEITGFLATIAKDRMSAWLSPTDRKERVLTSKEEVLMFLEKNKVRYGIKEESIAQAFEKLETGFTKEIEALEPGQELSDIQLIVVEGKLPEHGVDGYIKFHKSFENKPVFVPEEEDKNKVDFKNSMHINTVAEGEFLCEIMAPTYGETGADIFANSLSPRRGSPLVVDPGDGVDLREGNKFYALRFGRPSLNLNRVSVDNILEIDGDVNLETGNIKYSGPVVIQGDVLEGFEVHSDSEILINGVVEDALIHSKKKITVTGAIQGKGNCRLRCDGDIVLRYASNADIQARGEIKVTKDLIHCNVNSLSSVSLERGSVIGGEIISAVEVKAQFFGAENNPKTVIKIGYNYEVEQLIKAETDIISKCWELVEPLAPNIQKMKIESKSFARFNQINGFLKNSINKLKMIKIELAKRQAVKDKEEVKLRIESMQGVFVGAHFFSPGCYTEVLENVAKKCILEPDLEIGRIKFL